MAQLTYSHNIGSSIIGLTSTTVLTAQFTFGVSGISFGGTTLYLASSMGSFNTPSPPFGNDSTPTAIANSFAGQVSSGYEYIAEIPASSITITQNGETWNHNFGVTLVNVPGNTHSYMYLRQIRYSNAIFGAAQNNISYGVINPNNVGTTFFANVLTTQKIAVDPIKPVVLGSTSVTSGSTLSVSCGSLYTLTYTLGLGSTLTGQTGMFGIVGFLGCVSGNTLINSAISNTTKDSILFSELPDYRSTTVAGGILSGTTLNALRVLPVPTSSTPSYNQDQTVFCIPKHIPSGSYYIIPIPLQHVITKSGGVDTITISTLSGLPSGISVSTTPITITNNNNEINFLYSTNYAGSINSEGFTLSVTNGGFGSKLFNNVDLDSNTPSTISNITDSLYYNNQDFNGITNNLLGYSFNRLDYGINPNGSTVYPFDTTTLSTNEPFLPNFWGFIPNGLTPGSTLTIVLDGTTFYEKIYNPYYILPSNLSTQQFSGFGTPAAFSTIENNIKRRILFNLNTLSKKRIDGFNNSYFRVDFNNHSNPWGFTGFTYSSPSTGVLKIYYGNPANGISFSLPINTGGPCYYKLVGNGGTFSVDPNPIGVTLISSEQFTLSFTNRPTGYLEKIKFFSGADNSFIGHITLADNRRAKFYASGERYYKDSAIAGNNITTNFTVPSNIINAIGPTGYANIVFQKGSTLGYSSLGQEITFAAIPVFTSVGSLGATNTRGNLSGVTVFKNYNGTGENIIPVVDLMQVTVNHSLGNVVPALAGYENIQTRYNLGGQFDTELGTSETTFYYLTLGSYQETVSGTEINVSNRRLPSFREIANVQIPLINTIYNDISLPLRNYYYISNGYPATPQSGNPSPTLVYNYYNGQNKSLTELNSTGELSSYRLYAEGITLIYKSNEFDPTGYVVLNDTATLTDVSSGNLYVGGLGLNYENERLDYPRFIFFDYQIIGATLSKTSSVDRNEGITLSLRVKDLPPSAIFDGLQLTVYNGFASIFTKNLYYSTSSSSDYRIPNYNLYGNTLTNYFTASPLEITQIYVGSGSTLGGITISPPTDGWPASSSLRLAVTPIFKSFITLDSSLYTNPSNNYFKELTFTTAAQTTTGGGGGGSSSGSVSVSESIVTGVAFTSTENDFYAGFLCGTTAYNIITNNSTASYSVLTSSSTAYANAKAAFDAGTLTSNTSTDVEIHSLLNYMDYGGNIIVAPTIDGLLGSNYEYDIVFTEDNKRYGELMRIGSEKNHAIVIVGTSLEEDAASFTAPTYTNLNSAGLVDGLTYMTIANKGEYVFSVLGYKNRTRFYGSGTDTVRLYLSSDVAGSYARSYVENKYHLSSSGSARGGIRTYSNITPTIVDRDLSGYYTRGINPIYIPSGTNRAAIWGDATGITTGNETYRKSASISKNTSTIKREFKKIFEDFQFEQNNAGTRAQFVSRATTVLDKLQSVGGLVSYTLICNETNNTPSVVAQKRLVVDLTIVPNNSIESIVLNFVLNQI